MIYILSHDIQEISKLLDDKSLNTMIKDVGQVLQYAQKDLLKTYKEYQQDGLNTYQMPNNKIQQWWGWARECQANYLYLVELGLLCQKEVSNRGLRNRTVKHEEAIWWARDNVPDLPEACRCRTAPICMSNECDEIPADFPIIVPKKYQVMRLNSSQYGYDPKVSVVESYREWYKTKIKQKYKCRWVEKGCNKCPKWTNRTPPDWINDDREE